MNSGTLVTGGTRPAVRLRRHLPDPPGIVWQALTDREQLRAWFPCDVDVMGGRWTPGAVITFSFGGDVVEMTLTGEVLQVEEPIVLVFTWGEETLRFDLSADGDGTLLVLTDELPAGAAARNAAGWEVCLDRLTGVEPAPNAWREWFEAYAATFVPTLGPQDGPPDESGAH